MLAPHFIHRFYSCLKFLSYLIAACESCSLLDKVLFLEIVVLLEGFILISELIHGFFVEVSGSAHVFHFGGQPFDYLFRLIQCST